MDTSTPSLHDALPISITGSGATITWTTTEAATSQVEYGTTTNYGTTTTLDTTLGTSHTVTLAGLADGTGYHLRVIERKSTRHKSTSIYTPFTTLCTTA